MKTTKPIGPNAMKLAEASGAGRTTIWRWTKAGLLPQPTRYGREMIFPPSAIPMTRALAEASQ
jgi:predicted DNA-binding transcriptional regulator AlpA